MDNIISQLFEGLSEPEKASLELTRADLVPQWDAGDETTRPALELEFTEALNAFRLSQP